MDLQELIGALFNVALVIMIVATMVSAGFTTTFSMLGKVLSRVGLVLLVLATGLIIRPLVGWASAELFNLDESAYIAMVLLAVVGLSLCLGVLAFFSRELPGEAVGAISTIAGVFGICLKNAYTFEFGPSKSGRKNREDALAAMTERSKK